MTPLKVIAAASAAVIALTCCIAAAGQARAAASRLAFSHPLPALRGDRLDAKLVEVSYAPGESSAAHRHPCPVIGYVLEGSVRIKIDDGAETIYKTGEAFYEDANALHAVSANASTTAPARLLAMFTCDHEAPLVTPEPNAARP
jgi:quercetin dioxygenase-like cupin family protein